MAEEEQEQEVSVEETAGSKKKLIIMIVGGLVLLAVLAGAGLYFTGFFEEQKEPIAAESSESEQEETAEKANEEGDGEAPVAFYQPLTPPFMVNFPDGNIKVLKVAVSVMVNDEEVIDAVKKHDPIIRNDILLLLSNQDPETFKSADGKGKLQAAIKEEINKVLAKRKVSSKVKEVFFTDLVMQ